MDVCVCVFVLVSLLTHIHSFVGEEVRSDFEEILLFQLYYTANTMVI